MYGSNKCGKVIYSYFQISFMQMGFTKSECDFEGKIPIESISYFKNRNHICD